MAIPLRIELAGGFYHVTSRGDRREAIYRSDEDRTAWLDPLGHVCERFNWRCHAYCQMTNHYHVVVETPEANEYPAETETDLRPQSAMGKLTVMAAAKAMALVTAATQGWPVRR
jgi:REP element-mobilizing transposase RayT